MKNMKLIYTLAVAVALTFAATGCKHATGKVTQLPVYARPRPACSDRRWSHGRRLESG